MNIHPVLLFAFFSALCAGNTGLVRAKLSIFTGAEGGTGTIDCHFTPSGSWKFFCKDECAEEGILVKTDGVRAHSGRYSINYKRGSFGRMILSVTITNMTKSDSGQYRCGLGKTLAPDSFADFLVRVTDEVLDRDGLKRTNVEGETLKQPCHNKVNHSRIFFCRDDCEKEEDVLIETDQKKAQSGRYSIEYVDGSIFGLYVTITQVKTSDTGRYKCGYGRAATSESISTFSIIIIDDPSTSKPTQTLRPLPTLAPSSSTPTPTTPQSLIGSSSRSSPLPSEVSTTINEQPTAAGPTQQFSVPAQSLISSTAASVFSNTNDHVTVFSHLFHPDYVLPLAVCVSSVGVLLLVLLLLYMRKTVKNSGTFEFPVIYQKPGLVSECEDPSRD
ncbi:hypothetical protein Q5P01_007120 [Channa striata]|uniref:Immunoglobulin domain-containing protein n=1 Tax=Channa striata TaxID=64152 RepID=A0AA88N319_CHASR|nr:hypothetical protein Q5P01_007120 [Channa striata]